MTVWTKDMDDLLIKKTCLGYSYHDIASELGVSRNAAIARVNRLYKKSGYARLARAWRKTNESERARFFAELPKLLKMNVETQPAQD